MDRMKTFLIYALLIVGFFVISVCLENGLLLAMYSTISGNFDGYYSATSSEFTMNNMSAEASNVNGYMKFNLQNTTGSFIDRCFVKIELYNERSLLADTKYIEVLGMQPGDSKSFQIKFKANNIEKYRISMIENMPDKTNIINILGWEFDVTDVFGHDLSNATIFGVKLTDIFSAENAEKAGYNAWSYIKMILASVPWWGYAIAGGIIAWYMPAFYLFFLP